MSEVLEDHTGRKIRLTDERLNHIFHHAEMKNQISKIKETIRNANIIKHSEKDKNVLMFHKLYEKTPVTRKYLLAAVKLDDNDAFVVTAFFTDKIKKGEIVCQKK